MDSPHFILTTPSGIDKCEGGSQKRLAEVIVNHIRENDAIPEGTKCMPRIIGLEGTWGSGKSNVVKMVEDGLRDDYHLFLYDAWGHQEDLQRRSILELLTEDLVHRSKLLTGNTDIKIKGGGTQTVTWEEKLKYLLARKTESTTKKYPKLSDGALAAAITAFLTPIATVIAFALQIHNGIGGNIVSVAISLLPLIVALILWWIACRKDNKNKSLSYFLAIYHDKIQNDVTYETLSEDEPTVVEFKSWMKDISDHLVDSKKLILVFDNMDRLPPEKVKELWSSIHTFFAEDENCDYKNVWALIPFDRNHLACAFGDKECGRDELVEYFLEKTFPVIFRVTPPIITDYSGLFNQFYEEAFGDTDRETMDLVNRLYRLNNKEPNIRSIITFVNNLVALQKEWKGKIKLENIAIFILHKATILGDAEGKILSGDYLTKNEKQLIKYDDAIQSEISALYYGVDVELANQIPLSRYIESCFQGQNGYDINTYSKTHPKFDEMVYKSMEGVFAENVDDVIHCLNKLDKTSTLLKKVWKELADLRYEIPLSKQEFPEVYKVLLLHCDKNKQNQLLAKLYRAIISDTTSDFDGSKIYSTLLSIEAFIDENGLDCKFDVKEKNLKSDKYIQYLLEAGDDYQRYKITYNPTELETYLISLITENSSMLIKVIPFLIKDGKFTRNSLVNQIENRIKQKSLTKDNFGDVMSVYKILCEKRPLSEIPKHDYVSTLIAECQNENIKNGYSDLVAISLINGSNLQIDNSLCTNEEVAEAILYYTTLDKIVANNAGWNYQVLNSVIGFIIKTKDSCCLSAHIAFQYYQQIKAWTGLADGALLSRFDMLCHNFAIEITTDNLLTLIPENLKTIYVATSKSVSELSKHINKTFEDTCTSRVSDADLYSQRNDTNTYWHLGYSNLLSNERIKKLPVNLRSFGIKILIGVEKGEVPLPLPEYFSKVISKLRKTDYASSIIDVRNEYCNGTRNINPNTFVFYEPYLRECGNLNGRAAESVHKILEPVFENNECQNMIFEHMEEYAQLINEAGEANGGLKSKIQNMVQTSNDERLLQFAAKIGIEKSKE